MLVCGDDLPVPYFSAKDTSAAATGVNGAGGVGANAACRGALAGLHGGSVYGGHHDGLDSSQRPVCLAGVLLTTC